MASRSVEALRDAIAATLADSPVDLPDSVVLENTELLLQAHRQLDGLIATNLQVMELRQTTTAECGRSTRGWMVEEQRLSQHEADAKLRVARAGVVRPAVVEAMREGALSHKHAELITSFLPRLDADTRDVAETELISAARKVDPTTLNRGLRELQDRLCLDETAEERAARQYEGRWLRFVETFNGMVRIDGMLDPVNAGIVKTAMAPLTLPAGPDDDRHIGQRRADAFVELATLAMDAGQLPETAGEPTQCVLLAPFVDLLRELGVGEGTLSTYNGVAITPNQARMYACDAGIIPAVMGGRSEVLDLGRATPTWNRAQRRAAKIRAGGCCEAPGCQTPLYRCQLHHDHHWARGGNTDLANGIYLCRYHHWLTHNTTWTITRNKDGTVKVRRA